MNTGTITSLVVEIWKEEKISEEQKLGRMINHPKRVEETNSSKLNKIKDQRQFQAHQENTDTE